MKRQILVPLDGSLLAETVLPHAASMARLTGSEVILLRAVPEPRVVEPLVATGAPSASSWELWDEEAADAREYLTEVAERLQARGIAAQTRISEDTAAESILTSAEDPNVTLIAMATHGRSGLRRWVFGSVAERVIHSASKPVLLVRPKDSEHVTECPEIPEVPIVYSKILVPLDGSSFAEQAMGWAQALATASGASLVLTSVIPHNGHNERDKQAVTNGHTQSEQPAAGHTARQGELDRMSRYLADTAQKMRAAGHSVDGCVTEGRPAEGILRVGEQAHADLVVMATHGRSGLQRMWLGSVAAKIVQGAELPVLLVRAREHGAELSGAPK